MIFYPFSFFFVFLMYHGIFLIYPSIYLSIYPHRPCFSSLVARSSLYCSVIRCTSSLNLPIVLSLSIIVSSAASRSRTAWNRAAGLCGGTWPLLSARGSVWGHATWGSLQCWKRVKGPRDPLWGHENHTFASVTCYHNGAHLWPIGSVSRIYPMKLFELLVNKNNKFH